MSKKKRSDPGGHQKQSKKPRTLEPDVVVVVGGTKFQENSYFLRSCSGYFDGAFRSCMKESQEMRFDFPDKDPEEWELIRELLQPFPRKKITEENMEIVLSWFDELCVAKGIEECQRVLCNKILPQYLPLELEGEEANEKAEREELTAVIKNFDLSVKYNLKDAQKRCLQKIIHFFEEFPSSLYLAHTRQIPSFLAVADEESSQKLWDFIYANLPGSFDVDDEGEGEDALLRNPLLPHVIFNEIQVNHKDHQLNSIVKTINSQTCPYQTAYAFKKELRETTCYKDIFD